MVGCDNAFALGPDRRASNPEKVLSHGVTNFYYLSIYEGMAEHLTNFYIFSIILLQVKEINFHDMSIFLLLDSSAIDGSHCILFGSIIFGS